MALKKNSHACIVMGFLILFMVHAQLVQAKTSLLQSVVPKVDMIALGVATHYAFQKLSYYAFFKKEEREPTPLELAIQQAKMNPAYLSDLAKQIALDKERFTAYQRINPHNNELRSLAFQINSNLDKYSQVSIGKELTAENLAKLNFQKKQIQMSDNVAFSHWSCIIPFLTTLAYTWNKSLSKPEYHANPYYLTGFGMSWACNFFYKTIKLHSDKAALAKWLQEIGGKQVAFEEAVQKNCLDEVQKLVTQGVNIHGRLQYPLTPLMQSTSNRNLEMVSLLLQQSINIPTTEGDSTNAALNSALKYALEGSNNDTISHEIVKALITHPHIWMQFKEEIEKLLIEHPAQKAREIFCEKYKETYDTDATTLFTLVLNHLKQLTALKPNTIDTDSMD